MPSNISAQLTSGSVITEPVHGIIWENRPSRNIYVEFQNNRNVISRASLKGDSGNPTGSRRNAWLIVWEPFYSNGIINIPFREIWAKLVREGKNTNESAILYRGIDITSLSPSDWNLFEKNKMVGILPISVGRYIVLEEFEINKPIIYVEKVAKNGKYIDVITSGFPKFRMSLEVVIFGTIHMKVMQFFNIVKNLISEGRPGRLIMYDVLNQIFSTEEDFIYNIHHNSTPYYTLIPNNIRMERKASENTFVEIDITGTIAEISSERAI
jgi:hypothetical protein